MWGCGRRYSYKAVVPHLGAPTMKKFGLIANFPSGMELTCPSLAGRIACICRKDATVYSVPTNSPPCGPARRVGIIRHQAGAQEVPFPLSHDKLPHPATRTKEAMPDRPGGSRAGFPEQ